MPGSDGPYTLHNAGAQREDTEVQGIEIQTSKALRGGEGKGCPSPQPTRMLGNTASSPS